MRSLVPGKTCLFIVCEIMFTIGESGPISRANEREQQTQLQWFQQVERERRVEFQLDQRQRRQLETVER